MQYMFAPMEDTSDIALRTLCYTHGADVTFTEMTRIDSLVRKNKSSLQKIALNDTPTWIQVVGQKESLLQQFLKTLEPTKALKGINFNLGCPSMQLINLGLGCAMIKRIAKTKKLLKIVEDFGWKSSIKIRLGMNKFEKSKQTYLHLINAVDCEFIVIHCRTGDQHYQDAPDYSVLPKCVDTGRTIIANGDIVTRDGVQDMGRIGVKGVMIGRAAVCNPAIFDFLKGKSVPTIVSLKEEYSHLSKRFPSAAKYQKNFFTYLGRGVAMPRDVQG